MTEETHTLATSSRDNMLDAFLGYALLGILSIGSRVYTFLWVGVIGFGFAFPPLWSRLTQRKLIKDTSPGSRAQAVGWGTLTGMAFSIYFLLSPNAWDDFPPPFLVLQLIVGAIIFAAILSPFQEIFFRNWLQPRLEGVVGTSGAIIMTSLLFMIWHWFPPFLESGNTSLNLISLVGSILSFLLGLVCGVAYSKTRRLLAPWLAHTIAAVTTLFLGKVVFVQFPE